MNEPRTLFPLCRPSRWRTSCCICASACARVSRLLLDGAAWVASLADAVAHTHGQDLTHGDIKPISEGRAAQDGSGGERVRETLCLPTRSPSPL